MTLKSLRYLPSILVAGSLLGGCGSFSLDNVLPDKSVEYKKEREAKKDLEVPPDLMSRTLKNRLMVPDAAGGASYSEYSNERVLRGNGSGGISTVLPEIKHVEVRRDGDRRWLVIDAPAEGVWNQVIDFWQESGVLLVEQDPLVGVMRTSWLENRANIKQDFITNTIRSVFDGLYEASTRDQYRVRLERGEQAGTTELYITHYAMEEEIMTDTAGKGDQAVWVNRPRDPGLESEMLSRIMVHLGINEAEAKNRLAAKSLQSRNRSQLIKTQTGSSLLIDDDFSRAWRLTGLALDRVGFAVEDRDRSQGIYFVRYNDPTVGGEDEEGWLSKINFWSSSEPVDKNVRYQIKVAADDSGSRVVVLNDQGQLDNSPTAQRILTLLSEQIR